MDVCPYALVLGANGGCASASYLSKTLEFYFPEFANLCQSELCLVLADQMIPLQLVPLYAADSWPNRFWTAPRNTTEWSIFMAELALSGNALSKLMLKDVASKLRGAHIGEFNLQ